MSTLPPPSRPEPPTVEPPRTGASLPPPRPAEPDPSPSVAAPTTWNPLTAPPVVAPRSAALTSPTPAEMSPAPLAPPSIIPEPAVPGPTASAFAPPGSLAGPTAAATSAARSSVDTPVQPPWEPAPPATAWTPEPVGPVSAPTWSPAIAAPPVVTPPVETPPVVTPPVVTLPALAPLAAPTPIVEPPMPVAVPAPAVSPGPALLAPPPVPVADAGAESTAGEAVGAGSMWDDIDLASPAWAADSPAATVDPWADTDTSDASVLADHPWPASSSTDATSDTSTFEDSTFSDATFEDATFSDATFEDATFDDDGADEARSEIEALIAAAEAEAAQRGGTAPLVFAEPEGVDLAAIVAAQPQEPPRPVLDVTTPGADSPTWLTDLVDSIEEGDDEPAVGTEATSPAFVSADTVIRAKPARLTTNPFAVLSLLASLVWVCGLGSVVGIAFGVVSLVQIASVHQRGRLLALAGLVLGVVGMTAALTLFVFDSNETSRPVISDAPAFGEVVVTSCALDASGRGAAVVRVVNVSGDPLTYRLTVAFQAGDQRAVETVESGVLESGATELITAVTSSTFSEAPVCMMQDLLRFVESD